MLIFRVGVSDAMVTQITNIHNALLITYMADGQMQSHVRSLYILLIHTPRDILPHIAHVWFHWFIITCECQGGGFITVRCDEASTVDELLEMVLDKGEEYDGAPEWNEWDEHIIHMCIGFRLLTSIISAADVMFHVLTCHGALPMHVHSYVVVSSC